MKKSIVVFPFLFSLLVNLIILEVNAQSDGRTKATMTINSFQKGGGFPSECDGKYHSDDKPVVALSTPWFNHGQRCLKNINIYYKDRSVKAMVVDECDCSKGCHTDIVDASKAVWRALRVPKSEWGEIKVTWSDA